MVCVSHPDKMWKETWWDHVYDPTWWEITVAALMDMMYRISWNSNLMWAPVAPNGTSSTRGDSVRTGGLWENTAETIFPSELTEKTHLCWQGTDDQRRTCRKKTYGTRGGGEAKARGGTVCKVSLSERDGERVSGQNTGRETSGKNESIKGSGVCGWTAGLETGRTGSLWNSPSQVWWDCSVQLLITLGCKEQGLQASTRSWAEGNSKSYRGLLEVITLHHLWLGE